MNKKNIVIILAVIFIILTIYYLVPGFYHLFVFNNHPDTYQPKHAILFFILAIIDVVFGRIMINKDKEVK